MAMGRPAGAGPFLDPPGFLHSALTTHFERAGIL